jgi:hypothetical protein
MSRARAVIASAALLASTMSCAAPRGPSPATEPRPPQAATETERPTPRPAAPIVDETSHGVEPAATEAVARMLARVAEVRGLPIRGPVTSRTLSRDAVAALIRAHVERDVPLEAVAAQGEALALLGLVPADYDFFEGSLDLLAGRIAGFYEPHDRTMYLVDDLGDDGTEETLMHELVHALQDQSFSLGPMLEFSPGEGDRLAAAHALIEGDATSAMLDLQLGSAFKLTDDRLRALLELTSAASPVAARTPRVLQNALAAPYADGFALVKALRRRGGYAAVDALFRRLPATTEQVLHLDKLDLREPAIDVRAPAAPASMPGFQVIFEDTMGEQGLRIVLEEWAPRGAAVSAAAGWGGDRYVVLERRDDASASRELALAWHLTMDTPKDATELTAVLTAHLGSGCTERPALGPITWQARGREIAIVAGPYRRSAAQTTSSGSCKSAKAWVASLARGDEVGRRAGR